VDIGPALAEARTQAGMTIEDVSQRTRIRGKIITEIEHDDYSSCGGDFYTRGHIRAIAKAVGTDPVPLIEEYDGNVTRGQEADLPLVPEVEPATKPQVTWPDPPDGTRTAPWPHPGDYERAPGPEHEPRSADGPGEAPAADTTAELLPPAGSAVAGRPGLTSEAAPGPAVPGGLRPPDPDWFLAEAPARLAPSAADRMRQSAGTVRQASAEAYRRSVPVARRAAAGVYRVAAGAYHRGAPATRRAGSVMRERALPRARRLTEDAYGRLSGLRAADRRLSLMLGGLVIGLAGLAVVIYALVSGSSSPAGHAAAAGRHPAARASQAGGRPAPASSPAASSPARSPAPAAVALLPAGIRAFGPGGAGDGDNPQYASQVLSGQRGGWHSNWYTSAAFGNLQSGTGLLLDMRGVVTVTQARLAIAPGAGGSVELRAGNQPVLAALPVIASSATGPATVTLTPGHPVQARYLLIWFSRLPADSSGTYQATIYHLAITGRP
jgi:transcriptional regulator with XRE-family HTH domain